MTRHARLNRASTFETGGLILALIGSSFAFTSAVTLPMHHPANFIGDLLVKTASSFLTGVVGTTDALGATAA